MVAQQHGGELVTFTRRFLGDDWLESILQVLTLGIGWLLWFRVTAREGRTPAKRFLHIYIHDIDSGDIASTNQVWLREIVAKYGAAAMAGLATAVLANDARLFQLGFAAYYLGGGALSLLNEDRRALWDVIAGTIVLFHPGGLVPGAPGVSQEGVYASPELTLRELELMRFRGLVDEAQYVTKRKAILSRVRAGSDAFPRAVRRLL